MIDDEVILSAARRLFETLGPKRVTMADVARHSGVSRATLYRRWPNSTALLTEFVNRDFIRMAEAAVALDAVENESVPVGRERIVTGILRVVAAMRSNVLLHTIIQFDPEYLLTYLIRRRGTSSDVFLELLVDFLRIGAEEGSVRSDNHEMVAASILLTCYSFVLSGPIMTDDIERLDDTLRDLIDRLLQP